MVQDIRRIILSEEEITSAIESYRRMTKGFLPEGIISSCKACDEQNVSIMMKAADGNTANDVELKLSCADLLRPLVRFCLENNIMLPRDGKKTALISKNQIMLCITLDLDFDLTETAKPMSISHLPPDDALLKGKNVVKG